MQIVFCVYCYVLSVSGVVVLDWVCVLVCVVLEVVVCEYHHIWSNLVKLEFFFESVIVGWK